MIVDKVKLSLPTYQDQVDVQKLNGLYTQLQNALNELVAINNKETTTVLYALKDGIVNGGVWSVNPTTMIKKVESLLPTSQPIIVETDAQLNNILYAFRDLIKIGYFSTNPTQIIQKIEQLLP